MLASSFQIWIWFCNATFNFYVIQIQSGQGTFWTPYSSILLSPGNTFSLIYCMVTAIQSYPNAVAKVLNQSVQNLNARVKFPSLIGLQLPSVATERVINFTNISRLHVLGGHSFD